MIEGENDITEPFATRGQSEPTYPSRDTPVADRSHIFVFGGAIALTALPFLIVAAAPPASVYPAMVEDGLVEWIGAVAWALASATFLATLLSNRRSGETRGPHPFWLSGFALMCFLAAGEEISWGQRVVGYETPALIAESNLQEEMNLHNLAILDGRITRDGSVKKEGLAEWLTFGRIGKLIWMGFLIALPIGYLLLKPLRRLVDRLRFPVPPTSVAVAGIVCYASFVALLRYGAGLERGAEMVRIGADETKETVVAVLFLLSALAVHRRRT